MKRFLWDDRGYALVLTLLFMPVFIGLSLVIIDLGRGNNAHSDLNAAADALALAAAGELDGGPDAIDRAKDAMTEVRNSVSFLSLEDGEFEITLGYAGDCGTKPFNVIFLTDIPANDEDPIDQAWVDNYGIACASATPAEQASAKYVYVAAQSVDLDTIFPLPVSFTDQDVPVQAKAVAMRRSAACGITPLFICNPFEEDVANGGDDLQQSFADGKLHGRLIKLHPKGNSTAGPGNFGYLDLGSGKSDLKQFFLEDGSPFCYDDTVTTEPGAATSVADAINVRFDIFDKNDKRREKYTPAINVRKGYGPNPTSPCETALVPPPTDGSDPTVMGFPKNSMMSAVNTDVSGATIGNGNWPIEMYFKVNHGKTLTDADISQLPNSFPISEYPGASIPSRYDIYRYEINQTIEGIENMVSNSSTGGETGNPVCSAGDAKAPTPHDTPDRRLIQAAIINCKANPPQGKTGPVKVEAYASVFLTNPVETGGGQPGEINLEIVDITGAGGLGTLDSYIRVEAVLVR